MFYIPRCFINLLLIPRLFAGYQYVPWTSKALLAVVQNNYLDNIHKWRNTWRFFSFKPYQKNILFTGLGVLGPPSLLCHEQFFIDCPVVWCEHKPSHLSFPPASVGALTGCAGLISDWRWDQGALPLVSITVPFVDTLHLGMTIWEIKQGTILFCSHVPVGFKIHLEEEGGAFS